MNRRRHARLAGRACARDRRARPDRRRRMGAGGDGDHQARQHDLHRGRAVHLELHLPGRRRNVYIGQAAHCSGTGGATETNGCDSGSLPIGTPVEIDGASQPGTHGLQLVAHDAGARARPNPDACQYNDFALVKIDPADVGSVNPSVPGFGGPTGVGPSAATLGDTVYSYGNSSLREGVTKLSPKQGIVAQSEGNGWSRTVYTVTPGDPGRLGQRLHERDRPGDRRPEHPAARAPRRPRTASATCARSSTTCAPTARSAASASSTARSRSTPTSSARSWAPSSRRMSRTVRPALGLGGPLRRRAVVDRGRVDRVLAEHEHEHGDDRDPEQRSR